MCTGPITYAGQAAIAADVENLKAATKGSAAAEVFMTAIAPGSFARGQNLHHRLISAGGASLRTHWNAGEALTAIREGGYDAVVLQEQSTLPVKNAVRMHENVRLFDTAIEAAGATTLLYMTWARRNAPESQSCQPA